jgi:hypothetical protein
MHYEKTIHQNYSVEIKPLYISHRRPLASIEHTFLTCNVYTWLISRHVQGCHLKTSLIIHEEETKKIAAMSVILYVIKNQVKYINFSFDFLCLRRISTYTEIFRLISFEL